MVFSFQPHICYISIKMIPKKKSGFTLMELLIIIGLISIIAVVALVFLNPLQQINKAKDIQRKRDLDILKKSFEDYYNDKSCYPEPNEVCYNAKSQYAPSEAITCNICGNNPSSPSFSPYLEKLPCDPDSPKKEYLYQVDSLICPQWFRVYSELNNKSDQAINELDCSAESCGPKPFFGYDFGVASPNTDLERATNINCFSNDGQCNTCGSYQQCLVQPGCQQYKEFYSSYSSCCENNDICAYDYKCTYNVVPNDCIQCGRSNSECVATGKCIMSPPSIQRGTCP